MSEVCEVDGRPDTRFVWFMERQLWVSDLPTDDEELDAQVQEEASRSAPG